MNKQIHIGIGDGAAAARGFIDTWKLIEQDETGDSFGPQVLLPLPLLGEPPWFADQVLCFNCQIPALVCRGVCLQ